MKPLLAYTIEDNDILSLKYPVAVTPKLDGIRAVVVDGVCYSRSMKPIRSKAVQELFGKPEYNGYDGELLYGIPTAEDCFNKSTSFVMSENIPEGMDKKNIIFYVFDKFDADGGYRERIESVQKQYGCQVKILRPDLIFSNEELNEYEQRCLNVGYEGVMVRDPNGRYKQGRSTLKEGIIGKLKRFSDSEAVVIGFEEKMHNQNEAKVNELGYTERSSAKDGLVGAGTLGSLIVHDIKSGVEFSIGSGFNDEQRQHIWDNRDRFLGELVKYKHFAVGAIDKPRFPIFQGIRHKEDM